MKKFDLGQTMNMLARLGVLLGIVFLPKSTGLADFDDWRKLLAESEELTSATGNAVLCRQANVVAWKPPEARPRLQPCIHS